MKQNRFRLLITLALAAIFSLSLLLTACNPFYDPNQDPNGGEPPAVTLSFIRIKNPPLKTVYIAGQTFDPTGIEVEAVKSDQSTESVYLKYDDGDDGFSFSPSNALMTADTEITVSYQGKTVKQPITVENKIVSDLAIINRPTKTVYIEGQNFDPAGMTVRATYNDGTDAMIPFKTGTADGYTVSPSGGLAYGTTSVTVTYGGKSTAQAISVSEKTVIALSVQSYPSKTIYTAGDTFSPSGMVVRATYNDNTTAVIPLKTESVNGYTFSPSRPLLVSDNLITISYAGKTATQAITVEAHKVVESIEITKKPSKMSYGAGETFDPANMIVTARYTDSTTKAVTGYTCSPNGSLPDNSDEIAISYKDPSNQITHTTRLMIKRPLAVNNFGNAFDSTAGENNAVINFWNRNKWTQFPDATGDGLPVVENGSLNFDSRTRRRFDAFRVAVPGGTYDNIAANVGTKLDGQDYHYTTALKATSAYSLMLFAAAGATTDLSAANSQAIKLSYVSGQFDIQSLLGGNDNQLAVASTSDAGYRANEWNRLDFIISRNNNFVTLKIYVNGLRIYFENTDIAAHNEAKLENGNFVFPAGANVEGTDSPSTGYPNYGHRFGVIPVLGGFVNLCPVDENGAPDPTLPTDGVDEPFPKDPNGIYYSDYGAKGDGVANDFAAIRAAHSAANSANKKVYADRNASYYIGDTSQSITIQTDTDWGNAEFIIDDSNVTSNRGRWIFQVTSKLSSSSGLGSSVQTLSAGQAKLNRTFSTRSLVKVVNSNIKLYIRKGGNANDGSNQSDIFIVDSQGNVDPSAPIMWNYDTITSATIYPIDSTTLTVQGGVFTTISNTESVDATYFARGIQITRSNTILDGLTHYVTGEGTGDGRYNAGTTNRPYNAFIQTTNCADVTVQNTVLTGRKVFWNNKGTEQSPNWVQQGTYDFNASSTIGLTVKNCSQTNSITDNRYWGIFTSNFAKNITFENVEWSRFDAHQGVWNVTIRDSKLGHQGMQIIGGGLLTVENTEVIANRLMNLRNDYGSTWDGDILIKNCTLNATSSSVQIFNGDNDGSHNFGYTCYLPKNIYVDGLTVTGNIGSAKEDLKFFGSNWGNGSETYAIQIPDGIYVRNLTRTNGSGYQISSSPRLSGVPVSTSW